MRASLRLLMAIVLGCAATGFAESPDVSCMGRPATVVGTDEGEELRGTPGDDVIAALGGDDTIHAGPGNDTICAGGGNDVVYGQRGNDVIRGNGGADLLLGGRGADRLRGDAGDDVLRGAEGTDACHDTAGVNDFGGCEQVVRAVPADFRGVRWLHTDVSGWAETATLDVSFSSSMIHLPYDKTNVWPAKSMNGTLVNANPWIFVFRDGVWYAATWEWMRPGQTSKNRSSVAGDHIKTAPLHDFRPVSGERYGFMVSGLARNSLRNVLERTPVVMKRWP